MESTEVNSCAEALRLLAAHLDRELDDHTHAEMERHLDACRNCYSRAEFEARLKSSIAALGTESVPPDLSARVDTLIRRFAATES